MTVTKNAVTKNNSGSLQKYSRFVCDGDSILLAWILC